MVGALGYESQESKRQKEDRGEGPRDKVPHATQWVGNRTRNRVPLFHQSACSFHLPRSLPIQRHASLQLVGSCVSGAFEEGSQRITNGGAERPVEFGSCVHTLSVDPRSPSHLLLLSAARRWKCVSICLAIGGLLAARPSNTGSGRPAFRLSKY